MSIQDTTESMAETCVVNGNGSVAHQIIGEFLCALANIKEYEDVAEKLKGAIFDEKPTEVALRIAMFGDEI